MKKVLKKIGKGIGIFFACIFGFVALCVVVTLAWGTVQIARGDVFSEPLPSAPEDFVPEVRFVVYTDTHNENENVADALETAYSLFDNDEKYKGVDAIIGLGDFTSIGGLDNYESYKAVLDEHERPETQLINILGNHEMKNENAVEYFKQTFGYEPNTVHEINGFTFICFSGSPALTEWTFSEKDLKWAADELKKAEEKADGKPIFTFQHPHNFGTVYGSSFWADPQTNLLWAGHMNVVNFSGHSHFPFNDPRSINQSTYTSIGAGAMARFELDLRGLVGQHPDGYDTAAEFCVVEANSEGSVRIRGYDLVYDKYFCDYFIEDVNDTEYLPYSYKNLKSKDRAPVFAEGATATAKPDENGDYIFSFDEPEAAFITHHFTIKICDENGKKVYKKTVIDDYYVCDDDDTADINVGKALESGKKYTAYVAAISAYHKKSDTVKFEFAAE